MFRSFRRAVRDFVSGYLRVSIKSCVGDPTAWERDLRERYERERHASISAESVPEKRLSGPAGVETPRSPVGARS
jgi:hypothetical protein